jgi:hypothetical protein
VCPLRDNKLKSRRDSQGALATSVGLEESTRSPRAIVDTGSAMIGCITTHVRAPDFYGACRPDIYRGYRAEVDEAANRYFARKGLPLVCPTNERGETRLPIYASPLLCSGLAQVTQRWPAAFKPTEQGDV